MNWMLIRLELSATEEFPRGSASRCYLLRLPLRTDGLIDEYEMLAAPRQATVSRFWPSEPDQLGYLPPIKGGCGFSCEFEGTEGRCTCDVGACAIELGRCLCFVEPDGRTLPFRIVSLAPIGGAAARQLGPRQRGVR